MGLFAPLADRGNRLFLETWQQTQNEVLFLGGPVISLLMIEMKRLRE